jgi:hypothetical protein
MLIWRRLTTVICGRIGGWRNAPFARLTQICCRIGVLDVGALPVGWRVLTPVVQACCVPATFKPEAVVRYCRNALVAKRRIVIGVGAENRVFRGRDDDLNGSVKPLYEQVAGGVTIICTIGYEPGHIRVNLAQKTR